MMDLAPVTQNLGQLATVLGIVAVTKSVAKLLDTVSDQVGLCMEPVHIRRKSHAEAEALKTEATTKAEVSVIKLENKIDIENIKDRAVQRVGKREVKRQENIEAIIKKAADEMPEYASDESVDVDWVAQFFESCQDVSNEQMQSVWAKLLAGEVASPGSFSRRSLGVIKVMSKADADLFTRFCSTVWQTLDDLISVFSLWNSLEAEVFDFFNLKFADLAHLDALGVIQYNTAGYVLRFDPCDVKTVWHYYGRPHILSKTNGIEIKYGKVLLTDVGKELAAIAGSVPNEEYRCRVVETLRGYGWTVDESVQPSVVNAASEKPGS